MCARSSTFGTATRTVRERFRLPGLSSSSSSSSSSSLSLFSFPFLVFLCLAFGFCLTFAFSPIRSVRYCPVVVVGLLGLEDLILLSMETSVSGESPQRRKGGPSSRQPWCNMSVEDRAVLENLPPELRTVDEFVQSVKEAAGRSLGSQLGGLTLGELERWLEASCVGQINPL